MIEIRSKELLKEYLDNRKEFWIYLIRFSGKTFRLTEILPPSKVYLRLKNSQEIEYVNALTNRTIPNYSYGYSMTIFSDDPSSFPNCFKFNEIYETEEECRDNFEFEINDQIDKLQAFYDNKLKYLQSIKKRKS